MHYLTLCAVFTFFSYSLGDNAFDDSYFALLTDIRDGINEQIQNYLVTPLFEKIKSIIDNRHTDCVFRCPQGAVDIILHECYLNFIIIRCQSYFLYMSKSSGSSEYTTWTR